MFCKNSLQKLILTFMTSVLIASCSSLKTKDDKNNSNRMFASEQTSNKAEVDEPWIGEHRSGISLKNGVLHLILGIDKVKGIDNEKMCSFFANDIASSMNTSISKKLPSIESTPISVNWYLHDQSSLTRKIDSCVVEVVSQIPDVKFNLVKENIALIDENLSKDLTTSKSIYTRAHGLLGTEDAVVNFFFVKPAAFYKKQASLEYATIITN